MREWKEKKERKLMMAGVEGEKLCPAAGYVCMYVVGGAVAERRGVGGFQHRRWEAVDILLHN
jgi:hypothetical protein